MKARNEYLFIRLPNRVEKKGGIELPESAKQEFMVGKILSVGDKLEGRWSEGTLVAFDKWVQQHLEIDVLGKETRVVVLHEDQVYGELEPEEVQGYVFEEVEALA